MTIFVLTKWTGAAFGTLHAIDICAICNAHRAVDPIIEGDRAR